ncbi:UNVERIFIED_CONTAM: hypothetical protein Slati_0869000 [Sesamum latifolium]|uniref:Uncharacterized protein n=1 Tax=Sesamum latifolium TaxID=2727402 RepID=A0AAW2XN43_9LAMI
MKTTSSTLNKQKTSEISRNTQALQMVANTPLAPTVGTTFAVSSRSADPLTEPPRNSTSLDTSSRGFIPRIAGDIQRIIASALREKMLVAVLVPLMAPMIEDIQEEEEVSPAR